MKARALLSILLAAFLLVPAGAATAADLHTPHEGTAVSCDGPVLWHFVHNQVDRGDTTTGELTATFETAGAMSVDAYKSLQRVRHYEVITPTADTLLGAADSISGGKLVLSHTECLPGEPPPTGQCVAGDTVEVTFAEELGLPTHWGLYATSTSSVSLLPGTYSVTLTSTGDNHRAGYQTGQTQEQWYIDLVLGGSVVATTGTISDLPDAMTTLTENVGTVMLPDGADTAVATHALANEPVWPSRTQESVEPTSALFTCL